MASGGNHPPAHPAPVSGPGAGSKRTDGGPAQKIRDLPGAGYGSGQAFKQLQQAAALSQTPGPSTTPRKAPAPRTSGGPGPAGGLTPFGAPTQQPNVPVTAGAALGPGPGPEALGLPPGATAGYQSGLTTLQSIAGGSGSSEVGALINNMQAAN